MPFQARELMRYPLLLAGHSAFMRRATIGRSVVNTPELLALEITDVVCLVLAGWSATRLFRALAPWSRLWPLPFALLIVLCLFDFYLTVPFSFPYDLPATMFLGWGSYLVLTGKFGWLVPVFALGTWNRETTLFLVLLSLAVAVMKTGRFRLGVLTTKEWAQTALLSILWLTITWTLHQHYRSNVTEAGSRISGNLHALLRPALWPNILSASAFLMPWIWLQRENLPPTLRAGVLLLPLWVFLLLTVGQILEVRIYGDISVFVAVCAAYLLARDAAETPTERLMEVSGP